MKTRTRAREIALQYLYRLDLTSEHSEASLDEFISHFAEGDDPVDYAREIVSGVCEHLPRIDEIIEDASTNWSVSRMSSTDRNILRIATYEILFREDIPYRVAINEGVELAKRFGSPKFPAFANGVLDKVSQRGG